MSSRRLIHNLRNPPQPSVPILVCSKLFVCVITITQIAIGAVYLHDCPRQHYIPIYLIVMGVFGLVRTGLSWLPSRQEPEDDTSNSFSRVGMTRHMLFAFFLFCWFIAGNVWIYSIYEPNYFKNSTSGGLYCNKTLYLFAFWTTTLGYILLGLILTVGFCVCFFLSGRADFHDEI